MLHKYIAIALGLEEFDEEVFAEDVEKVVVKGQDELIIHFYDGQILTQKWQSSARTECWTPKLERKVCLHEKNPRSSGTITCFTSKISYSKCGQNLEETPAPVLVEKGSSLEMPTYNGCGHKGLEENLLKAYLPMS